MVNAAPDDIAAWSGFAAVGAIMPSSSQACA